MKGGVAFPLSVQPNEKTASSRSFRREARIVAGYPGGHEISLGRNVVASQGFEPRTNGL